MQQVKTCLNFSASIVLGSIGKAEGVVGKGLHLKCPKLCAALCVGKTFARLVVP